MKTKLTLALEKTLYQYWQDLGAYVVEEVTMPDDQGIVDTLVLDHSEGHQVWRSFELKVTKADFHSSAKLSFIGNYNYFVLPTKLYSEVKAEIPAGIGVFTYQPFSKQAIAASTIPITTPGQLKIAKTAKFQELKVDATELATRFIASLNREVVKAKRVEKGLDAFSTDQLYQALKKRTADYDIYNPDANLYDRFVEELNNDTIAALQAEIDALTEENLNLRLQQ